MGLRGPKPKLSAVTELKNAMGRYFGSCESSGTFPDYAGMLLYLGMTEKEANKLQSEDHADHEKYRKLFDDARLRRESWLSRRMVTEPKVANGCMNALKQEKNGGYIDKQKDSGGETKLTINLVGVGGDKLFKG